LNKDIEEKAPLLQQQRKDYEGALITIDNLTMKLEDAMKVRVVLNVVTLAASSNAISDVEPCYVLIQDIRYTWILFPSSDILHFHFVHTSCISYKKKSANF
jgi:hypothetical protein